MQLVGVTERLPGGKSFRNSFGGNERTISGLIVIGRTIMPKLIRVTLYLVNERTLRRVFSATIILCSNNGLPVDSVRQFNGQPLGR